MRTDQLKAKNSSQKEMAEKFPGKGIPLGSKTAVTSKANAGQDVHQQSKPDSGKH